MRKKLLIIAAAAAVFAAGCGSGTSPAPETTAQETAAEETTEAETEETTEEETAAETETVPEETEENEAEKVGFDVDELRDIMIRFGGCTEEEVDEGIELGRIGKPDGGCSCVFMKKDNPQLKEFLEACAGLDYEGADKERALSWIDSIAEDSLTANATIGDVTFQYMAISSNVMLSLAFAIG